MTLDELRDYISCQYGADPGYLFRRDPNIAVFKRPDNRKWFAATKDIAYRTLGSDYFDTAQETVVEGETIAVEIDAPADVMWAHIKQMGQDRAGLYSFERLERAFTIDIHNHYTIHPEWQNREVGDFLIIYQPPLNLGFEVFAIDEQRCQMLLCSDSRE